MIAKSKITEIVNEWLATRDYFLVDVSVSADNCVSVEIDHAEGVWIEDCADLSRHIESGLNGEADDYELEVGSAGLGQPFKVYQQYRNHIGLEVDGAGQPVAGRAVGIDRLDMQRAALLQLPLDGKLSAKRTEGL